VNQSQPGETPGSPPPVPPLSTSVFRGTLWTIAMRWVIRFVGLISLTIVARLLDKQDFGLVAVANAIAALPFAVLDLGLETAIIRDPDTSPGVYDTAFSIRVTQTTIAAAIVLLFGRPIARFYGDPRIIQIIPILALSIWVLGLENTWIVWFRRNLNFRVDFAYNAGVKAGMAAISIALAFYLRSYWALVYAQLAGGVLRIALSHVIAPRFPRPTFSHWRGLWSFAQWNLVRNLADYAAVNVDRLILGRVTTAGEVGAYTLGREIADVPLTEISAPANRALGPGIAKLQQEPKRLAQALTQALGAVAIAACPLGLGLAAVSPAAVPLLLGKGWSAAVPIVQLLALSSLVGALRGILGYALTITGRYRSVATLQWVRALALVIAGIPAAFLAGPLGMAAAFGVSELATCGLQAIYYRRYMPDFTPSSLLAAIKRPVLASLTMLVIVIALQRLSLPSLLAQLSLEVTGGALVYAAVLLGLWRFSGRPKGPESVLLSQVQSFWSVVSRA